MSTVGSGWDFLLYAYGMRIARPVGKKEILGNEECHRLPSESAHPHIKLPPIERGGKGHGPSPTNMTETGGVFPRNIIFATGNLIVQTTVK